MAKKFPLLPTHPERVCWGCDKYCPADSMACGNGSDRTQHPVELFGPDWHEWGLDAPAPSTAPSTPIAPVVPAIPTTAADPDTGD